MAHLTTFNLQWEAPEGTAFPTLEEVAVFITSLTDPDYSGTDEHQAALKRTKRMLAGSEDTRWDHALEHMTVLSIAWPDVLFTLEGHDPDDGRWKTFYLAGRSETIEAMVVFPEFDPQSLRSPATSDDLSMEYQIAALKNAIRLASYERHAHEEAAITVFRSLYGHAPEHLRLQYTGQGHITITAGRHPSSNVAVIIDPQQGAKIITNLHGKSPTTRDSLTKLVPTDTGLLHALTAIRTTNVNQNAGARPRKQSSS